MHTASTAKARVISARGYSLRSIVCHRHPVAHQTQTLPRAWQFNAMHDAYQKSGGLMRAAELVTVYNDCHLARWFSLPNAWLADRSPASALASAAPEVLVVARAQRCVRAR